MMDKIKNWWGSSTLDQDEYEKAMANMRAQEARRQMDDAMRNYPAQGMQNAAQQSALHNPYLVKDSRYSQGLMNSTATPSVEELYENVQRANHIAKELMHKIDRAEKKVEMLSGFYTWITEVHPEIAAQHKAMRDLYEAANAPQKEKAS